MISCNQCGICCTQLDSNQLYVALNRGDGVCLHFNESERMCRIYANRPDICNSETMYQRYFLHMSKEDFIAANQQLCKQASTSQLYASDKTFFRHEHKRI